MELLFAARTHAYWASLSDACRNRLIGVQPTGMPALQVRDGQRAAEQKALYLIRVPGFEILPLSFRFDALGHRREPSALRHGDDRVDQRRIAAVLRRDVAYEDSIDLERVDRKVPQVGQ